jgi:hypothetical protein
VLPGLDRSGALLAHAGETGGLAGTGEAAGLTATGLTLLAGTGEAAGLTLLAGTGEAAGLARAGEGGGLTGSGRSTRRLSGRHGTPGLLTTGRR